MIEKIIEKTVNHKAKWDKIGYKFELGLSSGCIGIGFIHHQDINGGFYELSIYNKASRITYIKTDSTEINSLSQRLYEAARDACYSEAEYIYKRMVNEVDNKDEIGYPSKI